MRSQDQAASAAPVKRIPPADARKKPVKYYKKAPEAPKRFKSAFIFFSTQKHREIRNQLGKKGESTKTTNVAKLVSEAWKNLSAEDRKEWDEMARQDKIRYETEKSMYSGPWKVQTMKRTPKDPDAPKRPMSAFLAYSNCKRAGLKRQDPSLSNADVSKILSKMWKEAPQELKQTYIDEEFKLRQAYKIASANWRAASAKKKEAERQQREDSALTAAASHPEHPSPPRREQQQKVHPPSDSEDESAADISLQRSNLAAQLHQPQSFLVAAPSAMTAPFVSAYGQASSQLFPYASYNGAGLSMGGPRHSAVIDSLSSQYGSMLPLTLGARQMAALPSMYDATRLASLQRLQQQALLQAGGEEFTNPLLMMGYNSFLPTDEYLQGRLPGAPHPG